VTGRERLVADRAGRTDGDESLKAKPVITEYFWKVSSLQER
jgi:hypothetical protein